MTNADIENIYRASHIDPILISQHQSEKNSFLDAPAGAYPPRKPFDFYTHNLKKGDDYILKHQENGRATLAIANDEANIVDMFLESEFQGEGIAKSIVTNLYVDIKDNFFTIKHLSLASLSSGIIAWHKMGFDFYNLADRQIVRTALSNALRRRVNIKDVTKEEFEEHNLSDVIKDALALHQRGSIPMYREIIR